MLQKVHKEIVKLIHMNWAVYPNLCEEIWLLYMKKIYNLGFFSHINNAQSTQSIMCYTVHFSFYKN